MDLGDIYSRNVNKQSINMSGTGGLPVGRERDPNLIKLENDVFGRINDEIAPPQEAQPSPPQPKVNSVSFEQALRELANGFEPIDDKS